MADDNLQNALNELETVKEYYRKYESNGIDSQKYKETVQPLVKAIQYLSAEIEALREDRDNGDGIGPDGMYIAID